MFHTLKNSALSIRPLLDQDAEFMLRLTSSPGWQTFISANTASSIEGIQQYIQKIISHPNYQYYVIENLKANVPIGIITFLKRDGQTECDLGFALLPEYEGQGLAYSACKLFIQNLASEKKHTSIIAQTLAQNKRSIRLLIQLGFEYDHTETTENKSLQIYRLSM